MNMRTNEKCSNELALGIEYQLSCSLSQQAAEIGSLLSLYYRIRWLKAKWQTKRMPKL